MIMLLYSPDLFVIYGDLNIPFRIDFSRIASGFLVPSAIFSYTPTLALIVSSIIFVAHTFRDLIDSVFF